MQTTYWVTPCPLPPTVIHLHYSWLGQIYNFADTHAYGLAWWSLIAISLIMTFVVILRETSKSVVKTAPRTYSITFNGAVVKKIVAWDVDVTNIEGKNWYNFLDQNETSVALIPVEDGSYVSSEGD